MFLFRAHFSNSVPMSTATPFIWLSKLLKSSSPSSCFAFSIYEGSAYFFPGFLEFKPNLSLCSESLPLVFLLDEESA
ncbi:hypothetical protein ZOSMA_6G00410 [Zostera marina]|uniref:Uncharacterized protein n=1 Tax=Zostera marina TaxID=29655 RepID=A0A0K9NSV4_ZOSMR|nr:hypothetical protein ZOSMA_6G00410 [Zostera marina]